MSEVDAGGMPGPPIEANEAIEAVELTKMWSPTAGLRPVSLTVAAGEMVVVRGRSGSGKSTLLALLAGLCRPDGGSARVAGAAPTGDTPWAKVALVPQVLGMAVELSIRENIMLSMQAMIDRRAARELRVRAGFDFGRESFRGELVKGRWEVERGAAEGDLVFAGTGNALASVIYGPRRFADWQGTGPVRVAGDAALGQRFVDLFDLGR